MPFLDDRATKRREFARDLHSEMRADVFYLSIRQSHVDMPEMVRHFPDFGIRLDSLPNSQFGAAPRCQLIAVSVSALEDFGDRQEALASARLRLVDDATLLQRRRIRMRAQPKYVERSQRTQEHRELLPINVRQVVFDDHVAATPRYAPVRFTGDAPAFETLIAISTPGTAVSPLRPTPTASCAKISIGMEPAPTN